ncbi:MAG: hypothetical protein QOI80_103, partial [Solirubrobacteraceae bacterium]|nr:hypothetical protein [Solirubrobacteraceae bacterium]
DPDLLAAVRARIASADEDELETLVTLELTLERQRLELPDRPFSLTPEQPPPARDPFVAIGTGSPGPHADLNHALILAEVAAATTAEVDFATRLALARYAEAQLERTAEIDAELEAPWGSEPVDVTAYARLMASAPGDRVKQLVGEGAGRDEDAAV